MSTSTQSDAIQPLLVKPNAGAAMLGIGRTKMLELMSANVFDVVAVGKTKMIKMTSIKHVAENGVDPALLQSPQEA